jgi:hypothetical protein
MAPKFVSPPIQQNPPEIQIQQNPLEIQIQQNPLEIQIQQNPPEIQVVDVDREREIRILLKLNELLREEVHRERERLERVDRIVAELTTRILELECAELQRRHVDQRLTTTTGKTDSSFF